MTAHNLLLHERSRQEQAKQLRFRKVFHIGRPVTVLSIALLAATAMIGSTINTMSYLDSISAALPVPTTHRVMGRQSVNTRTLALGSSVSSDSAGRVLGVSVIAPAPSTEAQINVAALTSIMASLVNNQLNQYLSQGLLTGPAGPPGASGLTSGLSGPNGMVQNGNGQTTSVIGGTPIVSYIPASQGNGNYTSGSLAGFTNLSAGTFSSGYTTISGNLNVFGPVSASSLTSSGDATIAGALSAATSTLSTLTVSGPATFNGSTTIAGLTVLGLNPGLTQGSIAIQGTSGLSQDNANLFYDATNHRLGLGTTTPSQLLTVAGNAVFTGNVGIGTTSPSSQLDLENYTVNTGLQWANGYPTGGNPQISARGNLDATTATGDIAGGLLSWNTAGTNTNVDGLMLRLMPGFTGNHTIRVIDAQNLVAGASTLNVQDMSGTVGVAAESQGASTGDNIGVYSMAGFATGRNIAGFFRAYQDSTTTPGTNIGVLSVAGHYGDSYGLSLPTAPETAGYFAIGVNHDPRPYLATSSALIADNGNMIAPIFIGKVAGVNAFQITSTGGIYDLPSSNSTNLWQVANASGTPLFDLDSTNGRMGIGTTTPSSSLAISTMGSPTTLPFSITGDPSQSTDMLDVYKGSTLLGRLDNGGSLLLAGRLQLLENGSTSTIVQALYSESGTNNLLLRAGPTANRIVVKNSGVQNIAAFIGNSGGGAFAVGSDYVNTSSSTVPNNGMIVQGNVGIGTTSPQYLLQVGSASIASGTVARFQNANGTCDINPTTNTLACSSDERLKKNITPMTDDLAKVMDLQPVYFNWNAEDAGSPEHPGFIAQQVQQVMPEVVSADPTTGLLSIGYSDLVPAVVGAMQQMQAEITTLQGSLTGNATTSNLTVYDPSNFSGDSVGEARILAGQRSVRVAFWQAYSQQPIVTVTPEDVSFSGAYVSDRDARGFAIAIPSATTTDVTFAWHSFASPQARLTVSDGTTQPIQLVLTSNTPVAISLATPVVQPVGGSSPVGEATTNSTTPTVLNTSTPATSTPAQTPTSNSTTASSSPVGSAATAAPAVPASSPPTVPPQSSSPDAVANSGDSSGSSGAPSTISAPAPSASPTAAPAQAPADPVAAP